MPLPCLSSARRPPARRRTPRPAPAPAPAGEASTGQGSASVPWERSSSRLGSARSKSILFTLQAQSCSREEKKNEAIAPSTRKLPLAVVKAKKTAGCVVFGVF